MDSDTVCEHAPVEPCSVPVAARDASASPSELNTLRGAADFRRVLSTGRRSRQGAITVAGAAGSEGLARVGLVVRRDVGNAVRRNRAKRRLRHALSEVSLEQGMDYVIMAERQVIEASFDELVAWLRRAMESVR